MKRVLVVCGLMSLLAACAPDAPLPRAPEKPAPPVAPEAPGASVVIAPPRDVPPAPVSDAFMASLFPVDRQKGTYAVIRGFPGLVVFNFQTPATKPVRPQLILDLPDDCALAGACPNFPNRGTSWAMEASVAEDIRSGTNRYIRHRLSLSPVLFEPGWGHGRERVYIVSQRPAAAGTVPVYWHLECEGWEGPKRSFDLTTLPELPDAPLRTARFELNLNRPSYLTVPDAAIRTAYHDYWRGLHERPLLSLSNWPFLEAGPVAEAIAGYRLMRMLGSTEGGTPAINLKPFLDAAARAGHPAPMLVRNDGAPYPTDNVFQIRLCPGFLGRDATFWDREMAQDVIRQAAQFKTATPTETYRHGIVYDIEPGAEDHCYCADCREAFRRFAGLEGPAPTAAEIRATMADRWFAFRLRQNAAIIAQFCASVKRNFPGVPAIVCTDPLHVGGLQKWCGVDAAMSDGGPDLFMNMPYYTGRPFWDDLELNNRKLKTPNFPYINPAEDDDLFFPRYTPEKVRQNILASAALGCRGIGFWPDDVLDGRYLTQIRAAFTAVARIEEYYASPGDDSGAQVRAERLFEIEVRDGGQRKTVGLPNFGKALVWRVHRRGHDRLITLFNYHETQDAFVTVSIPDAPGDRSWEVRDVDADRLLRQDEGATLGAVAVRNGFLIEVPRNGARIIEIRQSRLDRATVAGGETQRATGTRLAALRAGGPGQFRAVQKESAEIAWGLVPGIEAPLLKLAMADRRVYLDLENGADVVSWSGSSPDSDVLEFKQRGFLGRLILSCDENGFGGYPFELVDAAIVDGNPTVRLVHRVPFALNANPAAGRMEGLEVEKTVTLEDRGARLRIAYRFTNRNSGDRDIPLGYRVKNWPKLAGPRRSRDLSRTTTLHLDTTEGPWILSAANARQDHFFPLNGCRTPAFFRVPPWGPLWTGSAVRLIAADEAGLCEMKFTTNTKGLSGVYVWWSLYAGNTVEFISDEQTLAAGGVRRQEFLIEIGSPRP